MQEEKKEAKMELAAFLAIMSTHMETKEWNLFCDIFSKPEEDVEKIFVKEK